MGQENPTPEKIWTLEQKSRGKAEKNKVFNKKKIKTILRIIILKFQD